MVIFDKAIWLRSLEWGPCSWWNTSAFYQKHNKCNICHVCDQQGLFLTFWEVAGKQWRLLWWRSWSSAKITHLHKGQFPTSYMQAPIRSTIRQVRSCGSSFIKFTFCYAKYFVVWPKLGCCNSLVVIATASWYTIFYSSCNIAHAHIGISQKLVHPWPDWLEWVLGVTALTSWHETYTECVLNIKYVLNSCIHLSKGKLYSEALLCPHGSWQQPIFRPLPPILQLYMQIREYCTNVYHNYHRTSINCVTKLLQFRALKVNCVFVIAYYGIACNHWWRYCVSNFYEIQEILAFAIIRLS